MGTQAARARNAQILRAVTDQSEPHDAAGVEQALLGCWLIDHELTETQVPHFDPVAFQHENHRTTYNAIRAVRGRGEHVDLVTVADELARTGNADLVALLPTLMGTVPTAHAASDYARRTVEAWQARATRAVYAEAAEGVLDADAVQEQLARIEAALPASLRTNGPPPAWFRLVSDFVADPPPSRPVLVGAEGCSIILSGEGVTLHGDPRAGKSWLALDLAVSVAAGVPWLGQFPCHRGRVAYMQEEGGPRAWYDRLHAILDAKALRVEDLGDRFLTAAQTGFQLDRAADLARLNATLKTFKPDLVVLDPLAKMVSADENSATEMGGVVRALDTIRLTHGCAVLVVHHSRKPRDSDSDFAPGVRMRGSSALRAWGSTISVERSRSMPTVTVTCDQKDGVPPEPFCVDLFSDAGGMALTYSGCATDTETSSHENRIMAVLCDATDPMTVQEIADATGVVRRTVYKVAERLVQDRRAEVCEGRPRRYVAAE